MMLTRKLTTILMITILSLTLFQTAAFANETRYGYFDQMENGVIVGWGWDPATPNTVIPVRIRITSKDTSQPVKDVTTLAAIYREDLTEQSIGNGRHGFRVRMDWDSLPDGTYLIEGWTDGKSFDNTQTYVKGAAPATDPAAKAGSGSMVSLGMFRTTGYCPCLQCSEGWGRKTSTGATARANHTIAVDPRVIPYGSRLMINGVVYTAEDRGGAVKGNHVDIFFDSHAQTCQHGSQMQEVFLVP